MNKNKRAIIFIFITVMIDVIGFGIIIPVLPTLIEELTNLPISEASAYGGLLLVSFAVMQFLFSPVLGELSDKFGRRPVLLLSLLGLSLDYLLHAFSTTIWWLFLGRLLAGIGGASYTTANAYMADISSKEDKAKNFGLIGAAFGFGFIIGPAIGGIFGDINVRLPFYIAAALSFANFLFGYFFVPESLPIENRREPDYKKMLPGVALKDIGNFKGIGFLLLALFFVNIASQAMPAIWSWFTIEMFDWSEAEVGYSLSFVGLMVAIVQGGLVGKAVKKYGQVKVIKFGFVLWSIGMMLFAFSNKSWMLYAFMIPYALGGVAGPTLQGLLSNTVSEKEQGKLQGAITSMMSLTTIIGPGIATGLFYVFTTDKVGIYFPGASFLAASLLLITSTFLVIVGLKRLDTKHLNPI